MQPRPMAFARSMIVGSIVVASAVLLGALASAPAAEAQAKKPFRVVTTFTVIQDIAQNVAGTAAIVESITKPGAEIHDYQPTPARHRQGAVGRPRALERPQPRALVREVLPEREGRAERRRHRRRRAHGHRRGPLHRQAQPARLDVAVQRADLRREHPQGAGRSTTRPTPRPTTATPPPTPPRSRRSTSRCASASRQFPRRSAGSSRARAPSATSPATTACARSTCGRSTPTSRARRSRCGASSTSCARTRSPSCSARAPSPTSRPGRSPRRPARATAACSMSTRLSDERRPGAVLPQAAGGDRRDHRQGLRHVSGTRASGGMLTRTSRRAGACSCPQRARRHRHLSQRHTALQDASFELGGSARSARSSASTAAASRPCSRRSWASSSRSPARSASAGWPCARR